jgi:alkylhydroperoxidase family enzyme
LQSGGLGGKVDGVLRVLDRSAADARKRVAELAPTAWRAKTAYSDAVYSESRLPVRVFEAARMRIAQINRCSVCLAYRTPRDRPRPDRAEELPEGFYSAVAEWRTSVELGEAERVAIEFAERFALDHLSLDQDDAFWARLHAEFDDAEIVDLTLAVAAFVAGGRVAHVLGIDACEVPV